MYSQTDPQEYKSNKDSELLEDRQSITVNIPVGTDLNDFFKDNASEVQALGFANEEIYAKAFSKTSKIKSGSYAVGVFTFRIESNREAVNIKLAGIHREAFLELIQDYGFRKRYLENSLDYIFVRIKDNILKEVTVEAIKAHIHNIVKNHDFPLNVKIEKEEATFKHIELMEVFLKNFHNIFNSNFLELLEEDNTPEMRDTKTAAYFPFKNTVVKVTRQGIETIEYSDLQNLVVWESHINKHDYNSPNNNSTGMFEQFIINVSNNDPERVKAVKTGLGYVLNAHNSSSQGQAVILYDEEITDLKNPKGGTGKGLIIQALGKMRATSVISGKHYNADDKFAFQNVDQTTQIIAIDDLKPEIPFESFFSNLTDGLTIEQKFKATIKLSAEKTPKFIFTSNSILGGGGSSTRRRQFILELSNYYSKNIEAGNEKPIITQHGCEFFGDEWNGTEWNSFFSFMLNCVRDYLTSGLCTYKLVGVERNRLVQTLGDDFTDWIEEQDFIPGMGYETAVYYQSYKSAFDPFNDRFKQRNFTNLLKKYAGIKNVEIELFPQGRGNDKVYYFKFGI